ncbi:hypothetical protein M408DRAFT_125397 [Serendipita vermifera MAFF 305830]|uniref:Amine oxidase domain-containing protein n=1 Tax=Serendipita vermifera MAFF 305830 TaxID=933852 RepID=A0A0C3BBV0_SERVB|nr:hypothetical protein M408DRAFT_125397 [Serendipita vermifera MAFF 305830]
MKIAVVGSGCAGLGAVYALNEYSSHEVHLYEADSRPGGHANTIKFTNPDNGESTMVDTAFMVFSPPSYPNFTRLLRLLNVSVAETSMSFSLTRDNGQFEWASDISSFFCQTSNLFNPRVWRMLWDILRFNACARRFIVEYEASPTANEMTIGEYLTKNGYSDAFRDDYLMPLTAAIWSTSPETCATGYTAQSLLRYLHNHHLLQLFSKPLWLTIKGGSIEYVNKIVDSLPAGAWRPSTPVTSVSSHVVDGKHRVTLVTHDGKSEEYDHVILATHSDTTLQILSAGGLVTEEERRVLGGFSWTKNEAVLHSDTAVMPKNKSAWSAWNYYTYSKPQEKGTVTGNSDIVTVTSSMNVLQHVDITKYGPIFSTLNPRHDLKHDLIQARVAYDHPAFDASVSTQLFSLHVDADD